MRSRAGCLFLLVVLCASIALAQDRATPAPMSGQIYIRHVTVIDTETGKEAQGRTVMLSGQRIVAVRADKGTKIPAGAKAVDASGKFLIPGLWDMHVHGTWVDATLPLYIANGVTGVRDMFGPPDANKFRAELAAKNLTAPHIYLASPIIDGDPPIWPRSIVVKTREEARNTVDEQKRRGADFIKVYSGLSREAYFAIIDEAKRQQIPVEGHVPVRVNAWEAAAAKQKSIEHLLGVALACSSREQELWPKAIAARSLKEADRVDVEASRTHSDEKCRRLSAEFKKNGSWPVPTLIVYRAFILAHDTQPAPDRGCAR